MAPPTIAPEDVLTLLNADLHMNATGLDTLRPGAWSAAFGFQVGRRAFVVRFSEHADDFDRDAFAGRYASPSLPVPAVTHRGNWNAVHYAISERVPGVCIDTLSSEAFDETLPSLLDTLDALRVADVSGTSGFGTWKTNGDGAHASWKESLSHALVDSPDQRGGSWREKLESSPTGIAGYERDTELLLSRLNDMPESRHVLHCDMLNYNVFALDRRITGVIDWGCAMYGDFLYELAWFAFWWPWYPQWAETDVVGHALSRYEQDDADLTNAHERLMCYQLHIGLTHQSYNASIGNWTALEAVARHTALIANELR